jgi:hypothetical protein
MTLANHRRSLAPALAGAIALLPLAACDRTESHEKTTTTKTTQTPEGGVKTTKETTEKKVETQPK